MSKATDPPGRAISLQRSWLPVFLLALLAALIASLVFTFVMGGLYFLAGIPTLPELFGDVYLKHITVGEFIQLLGRFKANPKLIPLGLALVSMIGVGTALGLLYAALARVKVPVSGYHPGRREWLTALGLLIGMMLIALILFSDELRQNLYGLPIVPSTIATIAGLLLEFGVYVVTLCLVYRVLLPKTSTGQPVDRQTQRIARRQTLARLGVITLGVASLGGTLGLVREFVGRYTSYDGMKSLFRPGMFVAPITSNQDHYVVTQNAVDPSPSIDLWRLDVTGLLQSPGSYTYEELLKLPATTRAITLECIANGPGRNKLFMPS